MLIKAASPYGMRLFAVVVAIYVAITYHVWQTLYICSCMKRLFVFLLTVLYLAAGAGFTLRQHYCMGRLIGTAVDHPGHQQRDHRCNRCGMERKGGNNGCCEDKVKTFKSSPDHIVAKAIPIPAPLSGAILPAAFFTRPVKPAVSISTVSGMPAHGPPPLVSSVPLYLRTRSLRI